MNKQIFVFNVSSLEDLQRQLADVPPGRGRSCAVLSVSDPAVVVCPFQLEASAPQKIFQSVEKEAAGLLVLPVQNIVFDYHVFHVSGGKVHGVLACIAKDKFEAYVRELNQKKMTLTCFMPAMISAANAFFQNHRGLAERVCLLNFIHEPEDCGSKSAEEQLSTQGSVQTEKLSVATAVRTVQCVISYDRKCELLREIHSENPDFLKRDIVQTLKSVYAGSAKKTFDRIFITGDPGQDMPVVRWMEDQFQIRPQMLGALNVAEAVCSPRYELNVNLSKQHALTIFERRYMRWILNSVLAVLFIASCVLGGAIYFHQRQIQSLKASFDAGAYDEAVRLERMLK